MKTLWVYSPTAKPLSWKCRWINVTWPRKLWGFGVSPFFNLGHAVSICFHSMHFNNNWCRHKKEDIVHISHNLLYFEVIRFALFKGEGRMDYYLCCAGIMSLIRTMFSFNFELWNCVSFNDAWVSMFIEWHGNIVFLHQKMLIYDVREALVFSAEMKSWGFNVSTSRVGLITWSSSNVD